MGIFKTITEAAIGKITESAASIVDEVVSSDSEKLELKNQLTEIITKGTTEIVSYQRDVLVKEMDGNFLQKSWRPVIMLVFGLIVVVSTFYDVKLNSVPDEFWNLLKIGIGGYVGGRTMEKITDSVTKNMDITFLKKKNRTNE